jgi:NAD(P)-dependent dehydrogenase (short-subunit alcohol dehydrogenase family)
MGAEERIALVTGSSSGIGRGIAIRLASDGYLVVLNSRRADPSVTDSGVHEVKSAIEAVGGKADVYSGDISLEADRRGMMEFVGNTYGRLDLLVNNAGVAPRKRVDILDADPEDFDWLVSINLKGSYFLTQLAAKLMMKQPKTGVSRKPRIAFITSISAYTSSTSRGDYCISKAGLSMVAKLFADRLAAHGIPVIEIRPGIIDTPMIDKVRDKYRKLAEEGTVPQGRLGTPEDVAGVVSAFGRGDLDYCTGESIEVSGGFGLRRL